MIQARLPQWFSASARPQESGGAQGVFGRGGAVVLGSALLAICLSGCGRRPPGKPLAAETPATPAEIQNQQQQAAEVARCDAAVKKAESLSGKRISMSNGSGPAVVYHEVICVGDRGPCLVDRSTGQLAWRAMTCTNSRCPGRGADGRPFLFIEPVERLTVADFDGQVLKTPVSEDEFKTRPCPACGQLETVVLYELPETVQQRTVLAAELQKSEEVWKAALLSHGPEPTDVRSPLAINHDMDYLYRLYLIKEVK